MREFWVAASLLWLGGVGLRLTILAVPPVIALIQADLHLSGTEIGARALMYYLIPYCSMSLGAFGVIAARERELGTPVTLENLSGDNAWSGPIILDGTFLTANIQVGTNLATGAQYQFDITGIISDLASAPTAILNKFNNGAGNTDKGNLVLEPTIHNASIDLGNTYKLITLPNGLQDLTQFTGTGTASDPIVANGLSIVVGAGGASGDQYVIRPTRDANRQGRSVACRSDRLSLA